MAIDSMGYERISRGKLGVERVHRLIAAEALGHPLLKGAEVHHVDGDKANNAHRNLVICQDRAYHLLLHARARILRAGGNPNTQRICVDCKTLRSNSDFSTKANQCRPCMAARTRRYYQRKRAEILLEFLECKH